MFQLSSSLSGSRLFIAIGSTTFALLCIVFLGARNYNGNISTFLHMDVPFGEQHNVPTGIVLYQDAAYDGMLYYQVARDLPILLSGGEASFDSPYRYQRILLPVFAYIAALGKDAALPYTLLIINLLSAIGALALMLCMTKKINIHAFTIVANPAILVGILFSLTEPLSLFFTVLFFWLWGKNNRKMSVLTLSTLILSLLARETTIFLIGLLALWYLWKKQWKQVLFAAIPIAFFFFWQYFLVLRLGSAPTHINNNILSFPFEGPFRLIQWSIEELSIYRLSALSLLTFLIFLSCILSKEWYRKKRSIDVYCFLLSGLCATMFIMDQHIWGVITSIGRVITPLYPVYVLYATSRDTWTMRSLSLFLILISIVTAVGIGFMQHPYILS